MSRLGEAFRAHHRQLRGHLADFTEQVAKDPRSADLDSLVRFLREDLHAGDDP